jgi:hypothetical protein
LSAIAKPHADKVWPGRRLLPRYEFNKELRFSYRKGSSLFLGTGRTKDLGHDTIRFETDHELPQNAEIELRLDWPVPLQNVCTLELVVRGPLVRSDNHGFLLRVRSCEFQTCGDRAFDQGSGNTVLVSVFA